MQMKIFVEHFTNDFLITDNALAGKTLALNRPGLQKDNQTQAGPTKVSKNGQRIEFRPPLPSLWADLYSTWNMAYVTR